MFKKPNQKSVTSSVAVVGSAVGGALLSDGLVALIPADYSKWGKPAVALITAIASASVKGEGTLAKSVKYGFAGMSIKQAVDSLREMVLVNLPKQDATSVLGNFSNHVLGLNAGEQGYQLPTANFQRRAIAPVQASNSSLEKSVIGY